MSASKKAFFSSVLLSAIILASEATVALGDTQPCGIKGCQVDQQFVQATNKQGAQPPVVQSFYGNPPDRQPLENKSQQSVKTPVQGREGQQKVPIPQKGHPALQGAPQQNNSSKIITSQNPPVLAEFADSSSLARDEQFGSAQRVLPEVASQIQLSSSDINRIVCPVDIKDIVYSKEKGITVKLAGNNAFVKFLVMKKDGRDHYSSTPSEIFVVCGDDIYNIIAIPKRIPSQTVQLSPGKSDSIKKNISLFGELPFEKKVVAMIKNIYKDSVPDSISVQKVNKQYDTFQNINLVLHKIFTVDGEGLRIKEYRAKLSDFANTNTVYLREKDFLLTNLSKGPVAVSIDVMNLKKGGVSRIFIVERAEGGQL